MYERAPVLERALDRGLRPAVRFLHLRLGITPDQVTWASLGVSVVAALVIGARHAGPGLVLMGLGQLVDAMDGTMARAFGLSSPRGKRLDTVVDRLSETVIFAAFAFAGIVPWSWVALTLIAILLLTSVADRSGFDPGTKRFALYFGIWVPFPVLFRIIFGVNLAAYAIGLFVIDCQFQRRMDALGGDLDTVASRAAALEVTDSAPQPAD